MRHAWALVLAMACSTNARTPPPAERAKDAVPPSPTAASVDAMSDAPTPDEIEDALHALGSEHGARDVRNVTQERCGCACASRTAPRSRELHDPLSRGERARRPRRQQGSPREAQEGREERRGSGCDREGAEEPAMSDELALRVEAVFVRALLAVAERDKLIDTIEPLRARRAPSTAAWASCSATPCADVGHSRRRSRTPTRSSRRSSHAYPARIRSVLPAAVRWDR